jgi:DNA topoisomerase VI subunit B
VTEINRTSRDVKNKLEEIAKNDPNSTHKPFIILVLLYSFHILVTVQQAQALAAEERIKKNVHVTLVQDFIRAMEKYQQVQAQFKHKHEENVTRQVLTGKDWSTDYACQNDYLIW